MLNKILLGAVLSSAIIQSTPASAHCCGSYTLGKKDYPGSQRSQFRYIIVKNALLHDGRLLFVLIEEQPFSESTLRELFRLVSKRFPQPEELHVAVYTSLEQIPTPEEEDRDEPLSSDRQPSRDMGVQKHASAVYIRWEGNESFIYVLNGTEKTVILKGKDLLHQRKE